MTETIEPATAYAGSKGAIVIATMNGKHARTAATKLRRDAPERAAQIAGLEQHADRMDAEYALQADAPPLAGDNGGPPILTGWEAVKTHMDDLLVESSNWTDGGEVLTQKQADEIGRIRQLLQEADGLADKVRIEEKKPLD